MQKKLDRKIWLCALLVLTTQGCSSVPTEDSGRAGLLQGLNNPWSGVAGYRTGRAREGSGKGEVSFADMRKIQSIRLETSDWSWPLEQVNVTSNFGAREGSPHEGVDLKARSGTPVYAAQTGRVIYAGNKLSGYGKMVVIRHEKGLASVYAHNSRLLVRQGQRVRQGQKISLSGNTGRSSGPHLHFEVRDGSLAVDPTRVIPDRVAKAPLKPGRQVALRTTSRRNEMVRATASAPVRSRTGHRAKRKHVKPRTAKHRAS